MSAQVFEFLYFLAMVLINFLQSSLWSNRFLFKRRKLKFFLHFHMQISLNVAHWIAWFRDCNFDAKRVFVEYNDQFTLLKFVKENDFIKGNYTCLAKNNLDSFLLIPIVVKGYLSLDLILQFSLIWPKMWRSLLHWTLKYLALKVIVYINIIMRASVKPLI